jgi:sec-independent protein translocase protein TatC
MTIGEHLEELRWRVLRGLLWVTLASAVCLSFQDQIMRLALWPYTHTQEQTLAEARTAEAAKDLDARIVKLAGKAVDEDDGLARAAEQLDRARAIAREKAKPSLGELQALREKQDGLRERLDELKERYRIATAQDPVDPAMLADLERQHEVLAAEAVALRAHAAKVARPLVDARAVAPSSTVRSDSPSDMFMAYLKLAILAGLFVASPLVVREIWGFVAAGLYPHEKKYINLFGPLSFAAFVCGFLFGYLLMIPLGLKFLGTYGAADLFEVQYSINGYLSTFIGLSLVSGAIFELPLVMTFMAAIGFMTPAKYRAFRRYWILVAFIIAAILTPPDGVTQIIMAIPLLGLYELGIVLSALVRSDEPAPAEDELVAAAAPSTPSTPTFTPATPEELAARYPETPVPAEPAPLGYPEDEPLQDDPPEPPQGGLAVPAALPETDLLAPRPPPEGTVAAGAYSDPEIPAPAGAPGEPSTSSPTPRLDPPT